MEKRTAPQGRACSRAGAWVCVAQRPPCMRRQHAHLPAGSPTRGAQSSRTPPHRALPLVNSSSQPPGPGAASPSHGLPISLPLFLRVALTSSQRQALGKPGSRAAAGTIPPPRHLRTGRSQCGTPSTAPQLTEGRQHCPGPGHPPSLSRSGLWTESRPASRLPRRPAAPTHACPRWSSRIRSRARSWPGRYSWARRCSRTSASS